MVDLEPAERLALGDDEMERVQRMCLCPGCPAYPEGDRGEKKTYCMRGDSPHKEQIDPSDCLCESCEIYKHGKLTGRNFFCLTGVALADGMKRVLSGKPATKLLDEKGARGPALYVDAGYTVHHHERED